MVEYLTSTMIRTSGLSVKYYAEQEQSDPKWSGIALEWKGVDNKSGEQPWPQLMCCASICCHMCGYIFQKD